MLYEMFKCSNIQILIKKVNMLIEYVLKFITHSFLDFLPRR